MGIEFRGSNYKRDVSFGKRTIKDGEAVAVWNRLGVHRQVVGPRLVRLFFSTIVFLDKRTAGPNEYLVVINVDGTVEHLRGPTTMYENPVFHRRIEVKSAYSLVSASECIVVNREFRQSLTNAKTGAVVENSRIERQIVNGPNLYFPLVGDNVVEFRWSRNSPTSAQDFSMSPSADSFTVLNTSTRQWKVDLPFHVIGGGNSASGAAVATVRGTVQVTICFAIADVTNMLDNSSDLTGDLYDAMVVDMAALGASDIARNEVNAKSLSKIMSLFTVFTDAFPKLCERANAVGVAINGFAYRGFEPGRELARYMSELDDVDARLYRDRMVQEQEEKRIQADLAARQARLEHEQNLQQAQLAADKDRLAAEQEYQHAVSEHAMRESQTRAEAEMVRIREANDEALRVLSSLGTLGVDLTTLLTHQPEKKSVSGDVESISVGGLKVPALTGVFMTGVSNSTDLKQKESEKKPVKTSK